MRWLWHLRRWYVIVYVICWYDTPFVASRPMISSFGRHVRIDIVKMLFSTCTVFAKEGSSLCLEGSLLYFDGPAI